MERKTQELIKLGERFVEMPPAEPYLQIGDELVSAKFPTRDELNDLVGVGRKIFYDDHLNIQVVRKDGQPLPEGTPVHVVMVFDLTENLRSPNGTH